MKLLHVTLTALTFTLSTLAFGNVIQTVFKCDGAIVTEQGYPGQDNRGPDRFKMHITVTDVNAIEDFYPQFAALSNGYDPNKSTLDLVACASGNPVFRFNDFGGCLSARYLMMTSPSLDETLELRVLRQGSGMMVYLHQNDANKDVATHFFDNCR